jgi:indolepyruvate ferredoxin oxidoreductase alpha subunit
MNQPVLAVCGDSTFFHSVLPAMVNMRHNQSNVTFLVLENGGTAMTGFQPHPGLSVSAMSKTAPVVDVAEICNGMGINTEICDPFDLEKTEDTLIRFMKSTSKLNVLILRQLCALSPEKRHKKNYIMHIDETLCIGDECGCNRLCTRIFQCPGLIWDKEKRKAKIDEVICVGCGVCASICPQGAIKKEEVV